MHIAFPKPHNVIPIIGFNDQALATMIDMLALTKSHTLDSVSRHVNDVGALVVTHNPAHGVTAHVDPMKAPPHRANLVVHNSGKVYVELESLFYIGKINGTKFVPEQSKIAGIFLGKIIEAASLYRYSTEVREMLGAAIPLTEQPEKITVARPGYSLVYQRAVAIALTEASITELCNMRDVLDIAKSNHIIFNSINHLHGHSIMVTSDNQPFLDGEMIGIDRNGTVFATSHGVGHSIIGTLKGTKFDDYVSAMSSDVRYAFAMTELINDGDKNLNHINLINGLY